MQPVRERVFVEHLNGGGTFACPHRESRGFVFLVVIVPVNEIIAVSVGLGHVEREVGRRGVVFDGLVDCLGELTLDTRYGEGAVIGLFLVGGVERESILVGLVVSGESDVFFHGSGVFAVRKSEFGTLVRPVFESVARFHRYCQRAVRALGSGNITAAGHVLDGVGIERRVAPVGVEGDGVGEGFDGAALITAALITARRRVAGDKRQRESEHERDNQQFSNVLFHTQNLYSFPSERKKFARPRKVYVRSFGLYQYIIQQEYIKAN